MPMNPYTKTIKDIIDDTFRLAGDFRGSGVDGRRYLWSEVYDAVRDVVVDLVRRSECLKDFAIIPVVEDTYIYDLPADCLRLLSARFNGLLDGSLILPSSVAELDYLRLPVGSGGSPSRLFADILNDGQIGFLPGSFSPGSSFTRDSLSGLLRRVTDGDAGSLTYDAEDALRDITGTTFIRSGDGSIIRELISEAGNIVLVYVRTPEVPLDPTKTLDDGLPVAIHKDVCYGAAARMLEDSFVKLHRVKRDIFAKKWEAACADLVGVVEHGGFGNDMRPE